jgi:hypothetical protein
MPSQLEDAMEVDFYYQSNDYHPLPLLLISALIQPD